LFRHSRLIGKEETIFVISSALKTVGLTDFSARNRIRKLHEKGCLKIEETTRIGIRVSVLLPAEIKGCVFTSVTKESIVDIEQIDFYNEPNYRPSILERENGECFYCFRKITKDNYVLDHLVPQANFGNNTYRNIVASCHECNSTKTGKNGEDFIRLIYRKGTINAEELENRLKAIEKMKNGEIQPDIK
jgi:hypothetical protein